MIGTMMSSTFTVVFFLSTITAAIATSAMVEYSGGIWNAFSNDEEIELAVTWLMPNQQISPDNANSDAITDRFLLLPLRMNR